MKRLAVVWCLWLASCGGDPAIVGEAEPGDCADGLDNDGDGFVDCADFGCAADPACEVTDGAVPRDAGFDAGFAPTFVDAGPIVDETLSDACGDVSSPMVAGSVALRVDTRALTDDVGDCGATAAPGNDGFIAFNLAAGDQWHFHVSVDPSAGLSGRDPYVYLLDDGCSASICDDASDRCVGAGDEHFSVTVPVSGRFHLGIDDRVAGGGVYLVQAVRINCGDGAISHGESCDGAPDCTADCRQVLDGSSPVEREVNDNAIEANQVTLPGSDAITLSGSIGGSMCTYPDLFTFTVLSSESSLSVSALTSADAACDSAASTPFTFELLTAAGTVRAGPEVDGNGCAALDVTDLNAGRYYLRITPVAASDTVTPYRFELQVTGP